MRKGLSPVIAVVLLMAIAVIAAIGVYFWSTGLTTKQSSAEAPITINAISMRCATGTDNVTVMLSNVEHARFVDQWLGLVAENGTCWNSTDVNVAPGGQQPITFDCSTDGYQVNLGHKYTVYSNSTDVSISSATVVCQ